MTKTIQAPPPEETVTIPKASFDAMFRMMEEMSVEIRELRSMIKPDAQNEPLMNVNEAASYCGVSRQTISRYARCGKITKVVRGCKSGYLKSELDKKRKKE